MTIQVELSPESEARLSVAAKLRGLAPEQYAGSLLQEALASSSENAATETSSSGTGKLTVEELRTMLSQIAEGSENLPDIPTSAFSRESFYEGRS